MTTYANVGEALAVVKQLDDTFRARNALYDVLTDLILLRDKIAIPELYRATTLEVHAPTPFRVVKGIAAALSVNAPKVHFQPTGMGDAAAENQELREHFFTGSRLRMEQEARVRLFRLFIWDLVAKGEGVLKTMERSKRAWPDYAKFQKTLRAELDARVADAADELDGPGAQRLFDKQTEEWKREKPYPVVSSHIAPETFTYIKGENGFTLCVEQKRVSYYDVAAQYAFGVKDGGSKGPMIIAPEAMGAPHDRHQAMLGGQDLKLTEVWTWDQVAYILQGPGDNEGDGGGHIVRQFNHGYGDRATHALRGPYFHAHGLTTGSGAPEYAGVSVLFEYREVFPLLNSLLCMLDQAAFKFAYPNLREKPMPGELPGEDPGLEPPEEDQRRTSVHVGEVLHGDIDYLNAPPVGQALTQAITETREMAESAMPQVLRGIIDSGQSGYAINQAQYLASLDLDPIIDNAEFALGEQVGFESWLIEKKIKENVAVWGEVSGKKGQSGWLSIGKDDLKGIHRYTVKLDPKTPSTEVIRVRYHDDMLRLRLESYEDAIEDMGGSEAEVTASWLLYDLKHTPVVNATITQRAFQDLGTLDQNALGGPDEAGGAAGGLVPSTLGPQPGGPANNAVGQVYQPGQGGQPLQGVAPGGGQLPGPNPVTPNPPATSAPMVGQR